MGYDLLLGQRRRNWARGWHVGGDLLPTARSPEPTSSSLLERSLSDVVSPDRSARLPTIKEKLREAVPTATRLYEDYRPTYRDHQVVLKMKI